MRVCKTDAGNNTKQTLWTKRGIVRLGFFIKSERACDEAGGEPTTIKPKRYIEDLNNPVT